MKLLHINAGNLYGGVETFLVTLAKTQSLYPALQHEFVVCSEGRYRDELEALRVPVFSLGEVRARRPWKIWRARRQLAEWGRENFFDWMVFHSPWAWGLLGGAETGTKAALWLHGPVDGKSWVDQWARRRTPEKIITNSQFTAASVPRLWRQPTAQVVYLPFRPSEVRQTREEVRRTFQIGADVNVIIQVSRMERWKGQANLLQALAGLNDRPDWECWLVGGAQRPEEKKYEQELKALARKMGILARVRFWGSRQDVPDLLGAADIFCQINEEPEPFGLVFAEAMAAGLPVIGTPMGGVVEWIDEKMGALVSPGDSAVLGRVLRHWMENPEERRALGRSGRVRVEKWLDPAVRLEALHAVL
jgi:glycosyltransferase involved in cell wall biosynthesis